ncbi:hypothetical protein OB13_16665 [Pontibacter sp. HJ8]
MEPDKSLDEALFRSHSATEKANQAQHQLYNLRAPNEKQGTAPPASPQAELHESPKNLIQSWQTLRKLDADLASKKAADAMKKNNSNSLNK